MDKSQTTNKKPKASRARTASANDEDYEKPEIEEEPDEDYSEHSRASINEESSEEERNRPKKLRGKPPAVPPQPTRMEPEQPRGRGQMDVEQPGRVSKSQPPNKLVTNLVEARAQSKPKGRNKTDQHRATDVIGLGRAVMEAKKNLTFKDKFDEALNHLQENFVPDELPCREKEKRIIHDFIESGLRNKGNSQTLCSLI